MTTYVYETIPRKHGEEPRYCEIKQNMNAAALKNHPQTGEPIHRVVLGGFGVLSSGKSGSEPSSGSTCCGPSCGCH